MTRAGDLIPIISGRDNSNLLAPYFRRIARRFVAEFTAPEESIPRTSARAGLNSPGIFSLRADSRIVSLNPYGYKKDDCIALKLLKKAESADFLPPGLEDSMCFYDDERLIAPGAVINWQQEAADFGYSFDFPVRREMKPGEIKRRLRFSINNAIYGLENYRRRDFAFYAVVQGIDPESYRAAARELFGCAGYERRFHGYAIGSLQNFAGDKPSIEAVIEAVKSETPGAELHAFGLAPDLAADFLERKLLDAALITPQAMLGGLPLSAETIPQAIITLAAGNKINLPLSCTRLLFGR